MKLTGRVGQGRPETEASLKEKGPVESLGKLIYCCMYFV